MMWHLKNFFNSTTGNVSVMLAVAAVPILLAAGSAIDYLRLSNAKTEFQAALDGAALAAALPSNKTDAERTAIAKAYFKSNIPGFKGEPPDIDVKIYAESVETTVKLALPTSFMRVAGIDAMEIDESAEVMRPFDGAAEVVLVLDYSGSMNSGGKYEGMATAASDMMASLDAALKDDKLKMGLVPFSAMVHTSMDKNYVNQFSATATWTGCTQDRTYPHNTNVDTPTSDNQTKWGFIDGNGENTGGYGCSAYKNKGLKIVPLTSDIKSLQTKIDLMRPLGNTNIPLGAEFGWNLLDPQLPYDQAAPYDDPLVRKFLVLLTDGVQTSKQWGGDTQRSVPHGQENLLALCQGMRDKGITVFTIAYDIKDAEVTDLLKACAPGRYFEPEKGTDDITEVFSVISSKIKNQIARLSK